MEIAIGGRGRLSHITGQPAPPNSTSSEYPGWRQRDLQVFSWITSSIESNLVTQFIHYPTTRDLWNGLAVMYKSGEDSLQIYDLTTKADRIQQGDQTLEDYYGVCKALWMEIDRRQPNPMESTTDINTYNRLQENHRLFKFLSGLTEQYDGITRDILRATELPSVDAAYATVRREAARKNLFSSSVTPTGHNPSSGIGTGLIIKGQIRTDQKQGSEFNRGQRSESAGGSAESSSRRRTDKKCDYCGKKGHLKRDCFHLYL